MLNHIGTKDIKTDRLLLRKIKKSDYKDIFKYTSKEEVAKYVSWNVHKSIDDTKALCEMWVDEYKSGVKYHWAIVYDNKVIGNIEIIKLVDTTAIFGWQMDNTYWNMGIMTESAIAVHDYMFSDVGVDILEAEYMQDNIGSGRVMQKIGMKEYPIIDSLYYQVNHKTEIDGMPLICYRITKDEYIDRKLKEK